MSAVDVSAPRPTRRKLLVLGATGGTGRQEAIVQGSGLDWVLVRPTVLNDRPPRRVVRALTDLSGFHGGTIARADVASFVLDQVDSDAWLHRAPLVSW